MLQANENYRMGRRMDKRKMLVKRCRISTSADKIGTAYKIVLTIVTFISMLGVSVILSATGV